MSAPALPRTAATDGDHLPPISLPHPIRMPEPSPVRSVIERHARDSEADQRLSSLTYASEESFRTAFTSSSPQTTGGTSSINHELPSHHSPLTPRALGKSISVDSFIKYRRDQPSASNSGPHRMNSRMTQQRDSVIDPDIASWRSQEQLPRPLSPSSSRRLQLEGGRARGSSLSTVEDEIDASSEDSDIELSAQLRQGGRRRMSRVKNPGVLLPGELALPSRLPDLNINPNSDSPRALDSVGNGGISLSSSSSSHTLPHQERHTPSKSSKLQRLEPIRSTRSPSRYSSASPLSSGQRMSINTNVRQFDNTEISIAVVGFAESGKSTLIRKSLKSRGATDPVHCVATVSTEGRTSDINYISRTAKVMMPADAMPEISLKVMEVDTQFLKLDTKDHNNVWPIGLPPLDGVLVCYDASDHTSTRHLGELLSGYHRLEIPTIVVACKSDLEKRVSPSDALRIVQTYAGIVEVSNRTDSGKMKMKKTVDHLMKTIIANRAHSRSGGPYRNPASPSTQSASKTPWDNSVPGNTTPTASSSGTAKQSHVEPTTPLIQTAILSSTRVPRSPTIPNSPTRSRSTNDLLSEHQKSIVSSKHHERDGERGKSRSIVDLAKSASNGAEAPQVTVNGLDPVDEALDEKREGKTKEPPPAPWATLEELLDKLFFLSVSGDDPMFITHFFLTYRRFATPRSILLGMQKRMIELSQPSDDFMLASFAQMRICNLLEKWMKDYPSDFAVPGTAGALNALTKQTLSRTHTLHYGSDFLPFVEMLHQQVDQDRSWALKAEDMSVESDDSDGIGEDDNESDDTEVESPASSSSVKKIDVVPETIPLSNRERKSSLPLSAKALLQAPLSGSTTGRVQARGPKDILAQLVKTAQKILTVPASEVANEITRQEAELFLDIEPRHWLRHTLVSGKKDPTHDPIARFHVNYNKLHDWAISLILCHDKPKARTRQIEHLTEVACHLRHLNNYSGLRAIVTAISSSTYPGDIPMELFKARTDLYKKYQSLDILLHTTGSYRSYRLALRNTKGACIPALEVHMSDLLRAHEGNQDFKPDDPTKIHWAKFNMIGKFIGSTFQYQAQCRGATEYNFTVNKQVAEWLDTKSLDDELQQSRMNTPPEYDGTGPESYSMPYHTPLSHDTHNQSGIRRLFMW